MLALSDAVRSGNIPNAEIAVVISDKADARGLELAKERGIETRAIERRGRNREEHEREIISVLRERQRGSRLSGGIHAAVVAVFYRGVPDADLKHSSESVAGVSGLDAQRQALAHGVKLSGCTVHFVDETLDGGPIIAQRAVPVLEDDTVEALSARILEQEHKLYPEAVAVTRIRDPLHAICVIRVYLLPSDSARWYAAQTAFDNTVRKLPFSI